MIVNTQFIEINSIDICVPIVIYDICRNKRNFVLILNVKIKQKSWLTVP